MNYIPPKRQMPEGFAAVAVDKGIHELRQLYRASGDVVRRWLEEAGITKGRSLRPMPADFTERAKELNRTELRMHYRATTATVYRWIKEAGVGHLIPPPKGTRPLPDDFAELAKVMTCFGLEKHYNCSSDTVKRWTRESGVTPISQWEKPRQRKPQKLPERRLKPVMVTPRVRSMYDEAAEALRRDRWAVFRCDERGRYSLAGDFWRVGNVICTPDELLQRAERCRRKAA